MRCLVALLCLQIAVVVTAAGEDSAADGVLVLTATNFDEEIAKAKLTLVEFYAPWCGHCKQLAPEYAAADKKLKSQGITDSVVAKVDCTIERELCSKYDVKGFPTLKLFRNDNSEPASYDGGRKADAIVSYIKKQSQPAVTVLSSAEAIAGFAKGEAIKIIAYLTEEDSQTFRKVATKLSNEFSFGLVSDATLGALGRVRMARNFAEEAETTSFSDEISLVKWISKESFPIIGEIGPENYAKYKERGLPFVWFFIDLESAAQAAIISDVATPVAALYTEAFSFVKLDGVKWVEHGKSMGCSGETPCIIIDDAAHHKRYLFGDAPVTSSALSAWIDNFLAGSLSPHLKSEEIPATNNGPVTVVVGKTFESIVLDPTKNVFVEFYAPWCGHCKSLAPKYEELGKLFAKDQSVVIAKVDATLNDTPAEVQGFPTLKFYPAGDSESKKAPLDYSGDRTVEAMAKFIRANVKAPVAASAAAGTAAAQKAAHEEL